MMLWDLVLLSIGLMAVIKGGDWFVDSSIQIARHYHVPRIVIGGTLVSIGTTLPEMIVSATASLMNDSGIAIGNAVGSAIANIGLIVGLIAFLTRVEVDKKDFRKRSLWMLGSAFLVIAFSWDLQLTRAQGIILMAIGIFYLLFDYIILLGKKKKEREMKKVLEETPQESIQKALLFFFLGSVLIFVGSRLLVGSGSAIARGMGIPSVLIGLSVVAVGTSLPELVTAVTAARKKVTDLSIGNIVGANVLNLALISGLAGVINPLTLSPITKYYSFAWLLVFIVLMVWVFALRGFAQRRYGIFLLLLYAVYTAGLVIIPAYF